MGLGVDVRNLMAKKGSGGNQERNGCKFGNWHPITRSKFY